MATKQQAAADAYRCPECSGVIAFSGDSWGCTDCYYVPYHSAD